MPKRNSITRPCGVCGEPVTRAKSQMRENVFCSLVCSRKFLSVRFTDMNIELNPDRMTTETRRKLREGRLGKGEGKTYEKTYGKHTHRLEAEKMLGRKLKKGEVVHHIDGDIRNNEHSNLFVFKSQSEHARFHALMIKINGQK